MLINDIYFYKCETCGASYERHDVSTGRFCRLNNRPVTNDDFCSQHIKELYVCGCCGKQFIEKPVLTQDGIPLCPQCNQSFGLCQTCTNAARCAFDDDSSGTPKTIQKQVRQGNFISVQQVKNPKLIEITCQKGCHCWNSSFGCLKQTNGTCAQYQLRQGQA